MSGLPALFRWSVGREDGGSGLRSRVDLINFPAYIHR
jgi:hypothetical protein